MNKKIPCWISCKANAFARYFCNIVTPIIPPKTRIMESVVDNIKINFLFLLCELDGTVIITSVKKI
jgi:methyltransferase-like protein